MTVTRVSTGTRKEPLFLIVGRGAGHGPAAQGKRDRIPLRVNFCVDA